ncbi:MAG: hypothetical protein WCD70_14575 [Alphaproteobacteria bacterium]
MQQTQTNFKNLERELLNMKLGSLMEYNILDHWRTYEPKRVESLLMKGILRKTIVQMSEALWDMQMALEKTEKLDPSLAETEAWNRLMRHEEDEVEEAKAWGMTLEEYRNRPSA